LKCFVVGGKEDLQIYLEEGDTLETFKLCAPEGTVIFPSKKALDERKVWVVLFPNGNKGILYGVKEDE